MLLPDGMRFIPACAGNSATACHPAALPPVHPRVCGELQPRVRQPGKAAGSSPRVRGTRGRSSERVQSRRFIPACAGNSPPSFFVQIWLTVHPRVCGELPAAAFVLRLVGRFIPACAGNSRLAGRATMAATVHPRVCGELAPMWSAASFGDGSSPRVRGTPPARLANSSPVRFIPACAGNSPARGCCASGCAVHPRVCGELAYVARFNAHYGGSSPRVRGTRLRSPRRRRSGRFIPACAGNSGHGPPQPCPRTVHPRVCGELQVGTINQPSTTGSSPRVRGTQTPSDKGECGWRFIPACAGNSVWGLVGVTRLPVHPRVCGELPPALVPRALAHGSSPRVRGTPCRWLRRGVRWRFIPACAGNSESSISAPAP